MVDTFDDADAQRYVEEAPKDLRSLPVDAERTPYQRDRARVLHSAAFRRLAAKTQVHTVGGPGTAGTTDFLRTRLTHSLEVAQIAREMGARLGCDPDVVDVAGLAHDLGHPPFGHNGEDALHEVARAGGGFEGNAQTLRVLSRLEAKVLAPDGSSAGLNLTRASLDACCKYPWLASPGRRKFGVYADDAPVFAWVRSTTGPAAPFELPAPPLLGTRPAAAPPSGAVPNSAVPPGAVPPSSPVAIEDLGERRCLEAQVMDWADDVAYSVHDVEDGLHGGYIALHDLRVDSQERAALCADVSATYSQESPADLAAVLDELLDDPVLQPLHHYDGSHRGQVNLKHATSVLTGRLVAAAVNATRARFGPGPLRRYGAELVVPRRTRAECALLKGIALRYVMRRRGAESWYTRQREILTELVHALTLRAPDVLDPVFAPLWQAAPDDRMRLRVVVDQVASLTDPSAIAWHQRLVG
jgi:dGTPase